MGRKYLRPWVWATLSVTQGSLPAAHGAGLVQQHGLKMGLGPLEGGEIF